MMRPAIVNLPIALVLTLVPPAVLAGPPEPVARPIALLEGRDVKACGVRVEWDGLALALKLERVGEASELVLEGEPPARLIGVATTSQDTVRLLPAGAARGRPDATAAAMLWQELMVGGARFTVFDGRAERRFTLAGPLPQQVRAAYLNCAGDLFRP